MSNTPERPDGTTDGDTPELPRRATHRDESHLDESHAVEQPADGHYDPRHADPDADGQYEDGQYDDLQYDGQHDDAYGEDEHGSYAAEDDPDTGSGSNTRLVALVAAAVVGALIIGLLLWRPWSKESTPEASPSEVVTSPPSAAATKSTQAQVLAHPSRMFKAGNVYSQDISKAPMASNSAGMVKHLDGQVKKFFSGNGTLNFDQYHGTLWVASPNTKKITIKYDNCQNKEKGDEAGLLNGPKYFVNVPVPANAVPAKGTDGQVAIWSPSEDKLWELWVASKKKGVWYACWGGRIDNVSKSMGQMPYGFGASASGLAVTGSMISVEEAKALKIEHAMGLNIPEPANWPNFWYPANRTDGWSKDPNALPEGSRLRLDPSVDVDSLDMTPLAKAIAKAAQQYGFIVTDKSGAVAVVTEGGERRMVNGTGATVAANPWHAVLDGVGAENVLKGFPWDKLQVIKKDWGQPAGYQKPASG